MLRACERTVLAVLVGVAAFAAMAGSASANRISISHQNIRTAPTALRFYTGMEANEVRCPVTLEGSFHSSAFVKSIGELIGYITTATAATEMCEGIGRLRFNATLPWHIRYTGFTGRLPNIEFIHFRMEIEFTITNIPIIGSCAYEGEAEASFAVEANGTAFGALPEFTAIRKKTGQSIGCQEPYKWSGTAVATILGTSNHITVRLI